MKVGPGKRYHAVPGGGKGATSVVRVGAARAEIGAIRRYDRLTVRRRRHSAARLFFSRFFIAFGACFVLAAFGLGGAFWSTNNKWNAVPVAQFAPSLLVTSAHGKPTNILIVGSDDPTATGADTSSGAPGGTPVATDTIMIAHVDPSNDTGLLVALPHDLRVNIPGRGVQPLETAFNDGPERVVQTVETNLGVPINHYLEIDVTRLPALVNAIGGIPIYFPAPALDERSGLEILKPGCRRFNGDDAIAYVRSRAYEYKPTATSNWVLDPSADFGRAARQQAFLRSLAQIAIRDAAAHPLDANRIVNNAFAAMTKDSTLGLSDIRAVLDALRNTAPNGFEMVTLPATAQTVNGRATLALDLRRAAPIIQRLKTFGPVLPPITVPVGVHPNQVQVNVLNGTTTDAVAKHTLDALAFVGFQRGTAANADRSDYAKTEVHYKPGALNKAELVAAYVGSRTLVSDKSVSGADVALVIGADFTRVAAPASASPKPSKPSTTAVTTPPPPVTPVQARPIMGC
jgi:polyisoprenyl-teichoic acid--peptidoglycan teichoic acid transferase